MSSLAKRLFGPTRYLASGISFSVLFLVLVIAAFYFGLTYSPSAGILAATLAAAGLSITLESAIIVPFFYLQFHNAQLFVLFVTNLLFFQILVNAVWWTLTGKPHLRAHPWSSEKSTARTYFP